MNLPECGSPSMSGSSISHHLQVDYLQFPSLWVHPTKLEFPSGKCCQINFIRPLELELESMGE